jgi:hypothetical protein
MKTETAKYLKKAFSFKRMHAGRMVKAAVRQMGGLSKSDLRKRETEPMMALAGKAPIDMLEEVGMAMHRAAPDMTAHDVERRVWKARAMNKANIVVEGVRSPREASMIRQLGGVIVRCDKGTEPSNLQSDQMQRGVEQSYTLDTSSPSEVERCAKINQMLKDCY